MKPLAKPALDVVKKGKIRFHPERWTKVYLNWMDNIRDWCISRQIWWGHRIPVWYCQDCQEVIVEKKAPNKCQKCGSNNLKQEEDVLDTWFSSWLWPFATFYWPKDDQKAKRDLDYFYPTDVLVTAQEIIFFWVARMIMAGLEFMKDIPFRDVYIHGTVRDITGKKMSKSLGNVIDPLDIINEYGCDALRFSLISLTSTGQDVFLSKDKFESGRNFANKIWNAARFIFMNLKEEYTKKDLCVFFKEEDLTLPQKWILSSLYEMEGKLNKAFSLYRFNDAINLIYDFFWHKFCDWYVEIAKLNIDEPRTQVVLYKVFEKIIRMLHPFMPFITEEIWQKFPGAKNESISLTSWPHIQKQIINKKSGQDMQSLIDCIVAIRNLRTILNIPSGQKVNVSLATQSSSIKKIIDQHQNIIKQLASVIEVTFATKKKIANSISSVLPDGTKIYLIFGKEIDKEKERKRISGQIDVLDKLCKQKDKRLKNKDFCKKAPKQVVDKEKDSFLKLKEQKNKLKEVLSAFK